MRSVVVAAHRPAWPVRVGSDTGTDATRGDPEADGRWEDDHGIRYDVYGNQASAQNMYKETEDGRPVEVHPDGNGVFCS